MDARRPKDHLLEHAISWLLGFVEVDHADIRVCERAQRLMLLTYISVAMALLTVLVAAAGIWFWPQYTSANVTLVFVLLITYLCTAGIVLALSKKGRVLAANVVWVAGILMTLLGTMLLDAAEWHLHMMSPLVILPVIAALVFGHRAAMTTALAISALEALFITLVVRTGYADLVGATISQNLMVGAMMAFYTYSNTLDGRTLVGRRDIQVSPAYISCMSRDTDLSLTMILEYSRVIMEKDGASLCDDSRMAITSIQENAGRILESLDNFIDLLELERNAFPLHLSTSDPSALFYMLLNQFAGRAEALGLRFSCVFDPHVPGSLVQDWLLLRHALVRLLDNAMASTGAGGHVQVSTCLKSRHDWAVEIRDDGEGFNLPQRWESLEPIAGPGMSYSHAQRQWLARLALAAAITRYLGGRLQIRTARRHGSTVVLSLPLKSPDVR